MLAVLSVFPFVLFWLGVFLVTLPFILGIAMALALSKVVKISDEAGATLLIFTVVAFICATPVGLLLILFSRLW